MVLEKVRSGFCYPAALPGSVNVEDCLLVELLLDLFVVVVGAREVVVSLVDTMLNVECVDDVLDFFEVIEELVVVIVDFFEFVEVDNDKHERPVFVESANRRLLIA